MENCINKWIQLRKKLKNEISILKLLNSQKENSKKIINENINKFYELKIKTKESYDYNIYFNLMKESNFIPYEIIKSEQTKLELGNEYILIENFFTILNKNKKTLLFIINHYKKENYEQLINFLINFYFENPFNPNFNQNQLLGIIYNIIDKQVKNLKDESNIIQFLDDNFIGVLLKNLCRRTDIKNYISMILKDIILDMENMSDKFISFDLQKIREYILSKNKIIEKTAFDEENIKEFLYENLKISRLNPDNQIKRTTSFFSVINNDAEKFSKILLPPEIINLDKFLKDENIEINYNYYNSLNKDYINKLYQECDDKFMKDFYEKQINLLNKNNLDFSDQKFINEIYKLKDEWKIVLIYYKKNVEKIKFLIDKLLKNILDNETIIPYSIKVICKIIDILITKKFNNISLTNKNGFISEFFIGKIIIPILTNPDYNGIITSSIISEKTRKNMMNLTKILKKIFRYNFFESQMEFNYTIFNNYIIEILPHINNLFSKLTNIELPNNINSNEIENEIINHDLNIESLAFTYIDFLNIYQTLKKNENDFFKEIKDNNIISIYNTVKNCEKTIIKTFTNLKNINHKFFIIIKNINVSIDNFFNSNKTEFSNLNEENLSIEEKSLLQKIKLCIKTILINLKDINLDIFQNLKQSKNTLHFFEELIQYVHMEDYSERFFENLIPLGWYIVFIQYNLTLLNNIYKENDYENLYNEINNESEQSIQNIHNINNLGFLEMKISSMDKTIFLLNKDYLSIKKITKFIKINKFCNEIDIPVLLIAIKGKTIKCQKEKIKNANCIKIKDFIYNFKSLQLLKEDISSPNSINNTHQILENYLQILRNEISTNKEVISLFKEYINSNNSEEEINDIIDIIENNILEQVYDNLFTNEPTQLDIQFYNKCKELKNINSTKIGVKKEYINERLWSIAICYINRISIEKTPSNKLNCVMNAYKILNNCINFCGNENENAGFDDIFPIFVYIIIKCKPIKFISNFYYIKSLINPNNAFNNYGFALMQLEMAINFISNLKDNFE